MKGINRQEILAELETMQAFGETQVGWDENTPPNETVDAEGNVFPSHRGFGVADPTSPSRRVYDDRVFKHSASICASITASADLKSANRTKSSALRVSSIGTGSSSCATC